MIGRLKRGAVVIATLNDAGIWQANPILAAKLNSRFSTADHSPADGQFGLASLTDAALAMGARAETLVSIDAGHPGRIY